jgi:hypothetical protein
MNSIDNPPFASKSPFADPVWIVVRDGIGGPSPAPGEMIPNARFLDLNGNEIPGSIDEWDKWRRARSRLVENPDSVPDLLAACAAWFDPNLAGELSRVVLSAPFAVDWSVMPETDDERESDAPRVVRMSCAKWESVCLLARVVTVDLTEIVRGQGTDERREELAKRVVACSRKAVNEISDWKRGNLNQLSLEYTPVELNVAFFEATRRMGETLFDLARVAQVKKAESICNHTYSGVLLYVIKKASTAIEKGEEASPVVEEFARKVYNAVVASVAEKVVRAAMHLKVLRDPCISWTHVATWKTKRIESLEIVDAGPEVADLSNERVEEKTCTTFQKTTILKSYEEKVEPRSPQDLGAVALDYDFGIDLFAS